MLDNFCTYLIDEPESFLHPPQAEIMGQVIGETLSNDQQAFISTHSEEVLKGLLDICPERVKIVRITRENDSNYFSVLNNSNFYDVWNDSLLKYSNIMASLFHKTVVLCESDSDCKMYSIIDNHIKHLDGKYSETLFIHCGGKHRMSKVVKALRMLGVNVKLIPDIDILNDENVFKGIIEAFGGDWSEFEKDYKIVVSNLHSSKEIVERKFAQDSINSILNKSDNKILTSEEIDRICDIVKTISKWDNIKKYGSKAIPAADATVAYERIEERLNSLGIYIVSEGELECFVSKIGGHGPQWVNDVLELYPDLNDKVYATITVFIKKMGL